MQSESILVILDKPKHSQTALARAVEIATASGAHLHLVAFCWLPMAEHREVFDTHQRRALKKAVMHERQTWLEGQVLDTGLAAADVSTQVVWTDDIAGWVRDYGVEHRPRLVVKSVHHSKTLLHTPLDWQLIRESQQPLLLVAAARRRRSGSILATLDLKHQDRRHQALNLRVLQTARAEAERVGGRLHCVSVVEYSGVLHDLEMIDIRKKEQQAKQRTRELLDALLEPFGVPRARVHMPAGKVGQGIATVARKINADLLVVGTGARHGLGAALIGNSAEKILARAPCDLLVIRP